MPDQFSPEYKAYILSDEAKGLQDKLAVEFGTRILVSLCGGERVALVTEIERDPDAACDFYGIFEGSGRSTSFGRREVTIVPSLENLLQIIGGAGHIVKLTARVCRDRGLRYHLEAANYQAEDYIDEIESDLMLAAAKLAVRAIGNVEC